MTTRRGFFSAVSAMAAVAVGAELDLEKLLWVPGAKKIFIPPLLWVPDCMQCKRNIRISLARELTRITKDHGDILSGNLGHLFTKAELSSYSPDFKIAQAAYRIVKENRYYALEDRT